MSRDRDVRNAAHDLLMATGVFSDVDLATAPTDYASGVVGADSIMLDPIDERPEPHWDRGGLDGVIVTSRFRLTIIVRDEDPIVRDERAERLLGVCLNTLSDVSLAGLTFPAFNRWADVRWLVPVHPERKIAAVFEYRYLVDSSHSHDVTE
jgi:hypothetical protein